GAKVDVRKYAITQLGKRVYDDVITEKSDPRGANYYWIGGTVRITGKGPETDFGAIENNLISVTPLTIDTTAKHFVDDLRGWRF
ncbi:MAG: 5'/3'-nucleotidase SurE, partial [candidate division Zixibacteria bacterium]|nr:5'/3'-nucleotidase SurE [candidate division Zixibacteria bacterium]